MPSSSTYSLPSKTLVSLPSASLVPSRGARVEAGDAGAAGAQLLRQRALRRELQLELAASTWRSNSLFSPT